MKEGSGYSALMVSVLCTLKNMGINCLLKFSFTIFSDFQAQKKYVLAQFYNALFCFVFRCYSNNICGCMQ